MGIKTTTWKGIKWVLAATFCGGACGKEITDDAGYCCDVAVKTTLIPEIEYGVTEANAVVV